jgi:hypothetical protein
MPSLPPNPPKPTQNNKLTHGPTDLQRRLVNGHHIRDTGGAQKQLRRGRGRQQGRITRLAPALVGTSGSGGGSGHGGGGFEGRRGEKGVVDGQGEESGVVAAVLVLLGIVVKAGEIQACWCFLGACDGLI